MSSPFEHLHIKDNSPVLSDSEKQDALSDETLYETQRYQEQVSQGMIEGMQQQDGDRSSRMSTPGSECFDHPRVDPLVWHAVFASDGMSYRHRGEAVSCDRQGLYHDGRSFPAKVQDMSHLGANAQSVAP